VEAFKMWVWRRIERFSWTKKITNMEVLERVGDSRKIIDIVIKRKKKRVGCM